MLPHLTAIALLISAPPHYSSSDLQDNEVVVGGGWSEADGLGVGGPSLCLRKGAPGTVVGTVRPPNQKPAYAYLLVIRGDERRMTLPRYDGRSGVSGATASSRGHVEIDGRRVAFDYVFEGRAGGQPATETLLVNGKPLDLSKGRVVLLDARADKVTYAQSAAALPEPQGRAGTVPEVEAEAKQLLRHLRVTDPAVRTFLR